MAKKKERVTIAVKDHDLTHNCIETYLYNKFISDQANASNLKNSLLRDIMDSVGLGYWDLTGDDVVTVIDLSHDGLVAELQPWATGSIPWKDRYEALVQKLRSESDLQANVIEKWLADVEEEHPGKKIEKPRVTIVDGNVDPALLNTYAQFLSKLWFDFSSGKPIGLDAKITKDTGKDPKEWE